MTSVAGGRPIILGTSLSMASIHGRPVPRGTGPSRTTLACGRQPAPAELDREDP